MLTLSGTELLGLASPLQITDALERAIRDVAAGVISVPPRAHLGSDQSTLLVMPSLAPDIMATKLVTLTASNLERALPVTQGVMLLFDGATGAPIAMLDAAALTCQRTGGIAALAIQHLSDRNLSEIGLVGCGVQGAWATIMAAAVRPITTVRCVSRSAASFQTFERTVQRFAPNLTILRSKDAAEVTEACDVVVTATTSDRPVLPDGAALLATKLLMSIGSYRSHMQELPDAAYRIAKSVIVDSPHAITEVGDLINPLQRGLIRPDAVAGIADMIAGNLHFDAGDACIFKSVGYAAYDLAAARLFYDIARERGLGTEIHLE